MNVLINKGATLGTVLTMPASGYLSSTQYGWPSVFYAIGLISTGFGTLWLIFGADSPSSHKSISYSERNFIETSLGQVGEIKVIYTYLFIIYCLSFELIGVCVIFILSFAWYLGKKYFLQFLF